MFGKGKEELSPAAKEYKKTYERWFYGVLFGFVFTGRFGNLGSLLAIVSLVFTFFCLYESQRNYSLYKAARNESATKVQ